MLFSWIDFLESDDVQLMTARSGEPVALITRHLERPLVNESVNRG